MSVNHHFPRFHPRPRTGFVNDPNGPVMVDGTLHLYYQYRSATDRDCPVEWGHLSTEDLVVWRQHRAALSPEPWRLDGDGCWSGNTILGTDQRVRAFYAGFVADHPVQHVLSAVSDDGGHSFGDARLVVPDPGPDEQIITFRDPFVWWESGRYRMVVGAGDVDQVASLRLYESADLERWDTLPPLYARRRELDPRWEQGEMWECPQMLTLDGHTVALVGTWTRVDGVCDVLSFSGVEHDNVLDDVAVHRYDQGSNFYAASALRDSPFGGPLVWGWATEGREDAATLEVDWAGLLTLPRVVSLGADGRVLSAPPAALDALRSAAYETVSSPEGTVHLEGVSAQSEVLLRLSPRASGGADTVLALGPAVEDPAAERLEVRVGWTDGTITIDRSRAGADPRLHRQSSTFVDPHVTGAGEGDQLELRMWFDGSIVELFTSSGHCATVRFYLTDAPPWQLQLTGAVDADVVQAWSLRSGLDELGSSARVLAEVSG